MNQRSSKVLDFNSNNKLNITRDFIRFNQTMSKKSFNCRNIRDPTIIQPNKKNPESCFRLKYWDKFTNMNV